MESNPVSDSYYTIESPSEGLYKEKGSRFLSFAYEVENLDQIKEYIENLKKEHFTARHHCYAYILGHRKEIFRANDDGEPSGTAGKPIYGQLLSYNLSNILVVVVRYFGGTKLGTSGLIQAYKTATQDALEKAHIIEKLVEQKFRIHFPYEEMNTAMKILKDHQLNPWGMEYQERCSLCFSIRLRDASLIQTQFQKASIEIAPIQS